MMRALCIRTAAAAALVLFALSADAGSSGPTSQLIVKFRDAGPKAGLQRAARVRALGEDAGFSIAYQRPMALGAHVVVLPSPVAAEVATALAGQLAAHPDVEYAQPDLKRTISVAPNDNLFSLQGYLQDVPGGIGATLAWDITTGNARTIVAVLDTGYLPHTDLVGRTVPGYDFISSAQVANDGDGRDADPRDPGDWIVAADRSLPGFGDCPVSKSSWHGTSVAGVIGAATNNTRWMAGINWAARILPVRVLGKCGGWDSDILDGVAWAGGLDVPEAPTNANPAQVINMSLGGDGACHPVYQSVFNAVLAHGVTRAIVVAAGNESSDVSTHTPASCPQVIAVASTSLAGNLATYSNFGAGVALSAPGGQFGAVDGAAGIVTISNYGFTIPDVEGYRAVGGTSFASPMVAGVASLMLGVAPTLTASEVRSMLLSTAKRFPDGSTCSTSRCGAGIVDARAAVAAAAARSGTPAPAEGLWWNAPAGSESGWGINFEQQGDIIFATWFTYDTAGKPWWLIAVLRRSATNVNAFSGDVSTVTGPAFGSPWNLAAVSATTVGTMSVTFTTTDTGTLSYTVNQVSATKPIVRQTFAAVPTCIWGATTDLSTATNYQGLWWRSPAGSESGWGINFTHQGDIIFATWFTYDDTGKPWWLVSTMNKTAAGAYAGTVSTVTGPAFNTPWNNAAVAHATVGSATLSFVNGNLGTFAYTVNNVSQTKEITRQVFASPGTLCHL